jgi:5-oxoprolinase (ATP-hydrolysing) subunit A
MLIDLNSDIGESFGVHRLGDDAAIIPQVSSANIACGFHAGDPLVMDETVRLCAAAGVRVGAHPGHLDLQGFGRREVALSPEEAQAFVLYQVAALAGFARAHRVELTHVKPHGALYNQAAKDRVLAAAIARGVHRFSPGLVLVGLAGSALVQAGLEAGLAVMNEGFPDRGYNPDGTLMARRLPGALLRAPAEIAANALRLATEGIVFSAGGQSGRIAVQTLCLHGDNPAAVEAARAVRAALSGAGVEIG